MAIAHLFESSAPFLTLPTPFLKVFLLRRSMLPYSFRARHAHLSVSLLRRERRLFLARLRRLDSKGLVGRRKLAQRGACSFQKSLWTLVKECCIVCCVGPHASCFVTEFLDTEGFSVPSSCSGHLRRVNLCCM